MRRSGQIRYLGGDRVALLLPLLIALGLNAGANTAVAADTLYWGNESGAVRFGPLGGGSGSTLVAEGSPCGVAIDAAAGKIYWANWFQGTIRRANLDGSDSMSLEAPLYTASGGNNLCGVAVDPPNGRIYWANFTGSIWGADLDNVSGTAVALVTGEGANGPSGVAVDPVDGKLYWTNQFPSTTTGQVRRSDLDGGNVETLIGSQSNSIGVAVDSAAGKVYWTNYASGAVRAADLADVPGTVVDLATSESSPGGVAIDPSAGRLYWGSFSSVVRGADLADVPGTRTTLFSSEGAPNLPAVLRAPAGTGVPIISGGSSVGDELTCSQGDWAADLLGAFLYRVPRTFDYQWQKDNVDIGGETAVTYTTTMPGSYTCRVTATNQAGSTSQTSAPKIVSAPTATATQTATATPTAAPPGPPRRPPRRRPPRQRPPRRRPPRQPRRIPPHHRDGDRVRNGDSDRHWREHCHHHSHCHPNKHRDRNGDADRQSNDHSELHARGRGLRSDASRWLPNPWTISPQNQESEQAQMDVAEGRHQLRRVRRPSKRADELSPLHLRRIRRRPQPEAERQRSRRRNVRDQAVLEAARILEPDGLQVQGPGADAKRALDHHTEVWRSR